MVRSIFKITSYFSKIGVLQNPCKASFSAKVKILFDFRIGYVMKSKVQSKLDETGLKNTFGGKIVDFSDFLPKTRPSPIFDKRLSWTSLKNCKANEIKLVWRSAYLIPQKMTFKRLRYFLYLLYEIVAGILIPV